MYIWKLVKMAPCRIRCMDNWVSSRTWEVVNRVSSRAIGSQVGPGAWVVGSQAGPRLGSGMAAKTWQKAT